MNRAFRLSLFIILFTSCVDDNRKEEALLDYINPVYRNDAPDPSIIKVDNGNYYAYTTNANIYESDDLMNWRLLGSAFAEYLPQWLLGGKVWAPDINCIDGKYYLYYALSKVGEVHENGIGVAIAEYPQGPFTDIGPMFLSQDIGVKNSIDPCYYSYNGKHYLAWGSFNGIYITELTMDAKEVNKKASLIQIAGTAFEAPMIYERDEYFYLFCSVGNCCLGLASTYETVVCRSENIFGPYLDKEGKSMLDNNYEVILTSNNYFVGPGHNSELITDDDGKTWFLYHAYNVSEPESNRCLMLDEVKWDAEGWPYVDNHSYGLKRGPNKKIH